MRWLCADMRLTEVLGVESIWSSLEEASLLQISQQLDDVSRHGGRRGQMISTGLESVFIGHPVDGEYGSFSVGERVTSFGYGPRVFGFLAHLFLRSALLYFDAVVALESVSKRQIGH